MKNKQLQEFISMSDEYSIKQCMFAELQHPHPLNGITGLCTCLYRKLQDTYNPIKKTGNGAGYMVVGSQIHRYYQENVYPTGSCMRIGQHLADVIGIEHQVFCDGYMSPIDILAINRKEKKVFVIDIKSQAGISAKSMRRKLDKAEPVPLPIEYELQLAYYCKNLNLKAIGMEGAKVLACILYVNKDNWFDALMQVIPAGNLKYADLQDRMHFYSAIAAGTTVMNSQIAELTEKSRKTLRKWKCAYCPYKKRCKEFLLNPKGVYNINEKP